MTSRNQYLLFISALGLIVMSPVALGAPRAVDPFRATKSGMLADAKEILDGAIPTDAELSAASKRFDDSANFIRERLRKQIVDVYGQSFPSLTVSPASHPCNGLALCTISGTVGDYTFKAVMVLEEGKTMVMMLSKDGRSVLKFHSDGTDLGSEGAATSSP